MAYMKKATPRAAKTTAGAAKSVTQSILEQKRGPVANGVASIKKGKTATGTPRAATSSTRSQKIAKRKTGVNSTSSINTPSFKPSQVKRKIY